MEGRYKHRGGKRGKREKGGKRTLARIHACMHPLAYTQKLWVPLVGGVGGGVKGGGADVSASLAR
eukprot:306465-Chlamydomonas_euryale.AAC.1